MEKLWIKRADDLHCHVRDGILLETVIYETARQFRRAIIMPNLKIPITNRELVNAYRERIMQALKKVAAVNNLPDLSDEFTPLMTFYVTDEADINEYKRAFLSGEVAAAKLYPANATTNSAFGVTNIIGLYPLFKIMAEIGMPLLVHGEVTDPKIDVFDREKIFIATILKPLHDAIPELKIVLEHITTKEAVEFVYDCPHNIAATITPHHCWLNRNALFQGGLRPHHYCLPILKKEPHRAAIAAAATSGDPRFFAGTDSAPHPIHAKEQDCGCAGIYNGLEALGLYAEIFEAADALHHLENFLSINGARFYGLPENEGQICLMRNQADAKPLPEFIEYKENDQTHKIKPFRAGEILKWQLAS